MISRSHVAQDPSIEDGRLFLENAGHRWWIFVRRAYARPHLKWVVCASVVCSLVYAFLPVPSLAVMLQHASPVPALAAFPARATCLEVMVLVFTSPVRAKENATRRDAIRASFGADALEP